MAGSSDDKGLGEEQQTGFAAASLADYEAIYRLVLTAYNYRCALTGEQFAAEAGLLHPHLAVEAIRPRDMGGPLQINNYLVLEEHAARTFRQGQILIDDDYRIVVPNPDALDRAVLVRLNVSGRLLVPAEGLFQPSPAHLAFHRLRVLGA